MFKKYQDFKQKFNRGLNQGAQLMGGIPAKAYYFLAAAAALAFILILPMVFGQGQAGAQADAQKGQVLGAFAANNSGTPVASDPTQAPGAPEGSVSGNPSLIGPIVLGSLNQQNQSGFVRNSGPIQQPDIQSKALLVYNAQTQTALISKNEDLRLPIASLTKLMTAVVAEEDPNFSKPITITTEDQLQTSPILGLKAGDQVMPEDLVKAMLVGSANDAAWTLANHLPNRTEFVAKMNFKAAQLGMKNTSYANPVGFDDQNNFSTASDLQQLVAYALPKLPYTQIWPNFNYSFASLSGQSYSIKNSNDLVYNHPDIKSIKTGLTPDALQNMISEAQMPAAATSTGIQLPKIITIVLGAQDRDTSTLKAIDYVKANFSWQ